MSYLTNGGLERLWTHILLKLNKKVDKIEGKSLSTNDFTNEYKNTLDNLEEAIPIDNTLTQSGQAADAKVVGDALVSKINVDDVITNSELNTICGISIYSGNEVEL